ncbi:MAG: hypothetical protein IJ301_04895 [Clostridia bacterium]|nr:hypothetical protein [Clostridia bacterium]
MEVEISRYVGLAQNANGVVFGLDNIKKTDGIHLLLLCDTASNNLYEEICFISVSKKIPMHKMEYITLDQILNTTNCKAIGITNKHLASQIKFILDKEN